MSLALVRQLQAHARHRPDEVAVRQAGERDDQPVVTLTWRQWRNAAAALAGQLRKTTSPGDVILLGIGNHPAFHVAMLGVLLADRQAMALAPDAADNEIEVAVQRTHAVAAIGTAAWIQQPATKPLRCIDSGTLLTDMPADDASEVWSAHQGCGAVLLASSGTTGQPKIVRRLAPSLDGVAEGCVRGIGFQACDRVLLTIPVHHSYGLEHGLLAPLLAGSSVDLIARFDATSALARLIEGDVTIFPSVPFIFEAIAHARMGADVVNLKLHRAYSAGGPLPSAVFHAWNDSLGVVLGQLYGSTEVGSVTFNDPDEADFNPASIGRALPGAILLSLDRDDPDPACPLPVGVEGRIAVSSVGMMQGYIDQPSDELVDGYFLTNDAGWLDAQQRVTLTGRLNLLIDIDGRKVNPLEVEAVLMTHPDVAEAVVLPMRMTETLHRLKAVIVPREAAMVDVEQLRQFARARLSSHKLPRVYEVRECLPRTATGKIRREMLPCS